MPEFDSTTEYRPIPDFPGYMAGNDGSIWTCWAKTSRGYHKGSRAFMGAAWWQRIPSLGPNGYLGLILARGGRHVGRLVHRLVLNAFVGPRPPGMECCHGNGVRTDNRLANLRWDTRSNNEADKKRHGTLPQGERVATSKLTAEDVAEIRSRCASGECQLAIARDKGVSQPTVSTIFRRKTWKHL